MKTVFVTGATGYLGQALIPELLKRGHQVRALVRPGSAMKLPAQVGLAFVIGNPLDRKTFENQIAPADTFVQLVGVPHPSPAKAEQFRAIDGVSVRQSVDAARHAAIHHFIYVSVAQPAPIMKVYQDVRAEGESLLRASGLPATILRPWYILGPGHNWPALLLPLYAILEKLPATRDGALRLGLVSLSQMISALIRAVETPSADVAILEVPAIRQSLGEQKSASLAK